MKAALVCFVSAFAAAASYNFADSEFNELLDLEMSEWASEEPWLYRSKRETDPDEEAAESPGDPSAPPPPGEEVSKIPPECKRYYKRDQIHHYRSDRHHGCCGKGVFRSTLLFKNDRTCWREVKENMSNSKSDDADIYSCKSVNRKKKQYICMTECLAKKKDWVLEDGSLDANKAKGMVVDKLEEDWQKELFTKAFDACGNMEVDVSWKEDPEQYKCNPHALQMKHCIWRQVETNCPEEHKRSDKRCVSLRARLAKNTHDQPKK